MTTRNPTAAKVVDEEAPFASGIRGLDITLEDEPTAFLAGGPFRSEEPPRALVILLRALCFVSTTAFSEVIPLLAFAREGLGLDVIQ